MANKNKNVKELVSSDDDPTAELEVPTFKHHLGIDEEIDSDAQTFDANGGNTKAASDDKDLSVPGLEFDVRSQTKTIDRLQFDIEQLHARWLGLEAEIKARESQTIQLNEQLTDLAITLDDKEKLLQEREQRIDSLGSEIEQSDAERQTLSHELDDVRQSLQRAKEESDKAASELLEQQAALTDQLNAQLVEKSTTIDRIQERASDYEHKIDSLESAISQSTEETQTLRGELDELGQSMQKALEDSDTANREKLAQHAALTDQLNEQLSEQVTTIDRKENQIKGNTQKIESLESAIGQKDEQHQTLVKELDSVRLSLRTTNDDSERANRKLSEEHSVVTERLQSADRVGAELRHKLERANDYGDTVRQKLQDRIKSSEHLESERTRIADLMSKTTQENESLAEESRETNVQMQELQAKLASITRDHNDEIGILRFELGEAQNTATETEILRSRLTTDLSDARGNTDDLEHALADAEQHAKTRIQGLQEEVKGLRHAAAEHDENLKTKSEAITVLLAELSKKSSQLDSIGKIEDVIQDIDDRMSERFASHKGNDSGNGAGRENRQNNSLTERVTRVMVGTIDNQVIRFPLFKDRMTIGRTEDNDIHLKATYVSRRHAVVESDDDATRIIDWESKNGIYVNSERVSEHILVQGDIVTIGNARFRYEELKKREI